MQLCQPHLERYGRKVAAARVIAGTPMCRLCSSGKTGLELEQAEVRASRRAAMKAAWAKPEVRAQRRAAMKAAWAKPEVRARLRAAMKARAMAWNLLSAQARQKLLEQASV